MSDTVHVTETGCAATKWIVEQLCSQVAPPDKAFAVLQGQILLYNDGSIEMNLGDGPKQFWPGETLDFSVTHQGQKRDILTVRYLSSWMPMDVEVGP